MVFSIYFVPAAGGFGSYLMGLSRKTYEQAGVDTEGNSPNSIKDPGLGWMIGFLFVVCFVGLFVLIPLRKVYKCMWLHLLFLFSVIFCTHKLN